MPSTLADFAGKVVRFRRFGAPWWFFAYCAGPSQTYPDSMLRVAGYDAFGRLGRECNLRVSYAPSGPDWLEVQVVDIPND